MLKPFLLASVFTLYSSWAQTPDFYRQVAHAQGVDADKLYATALANAAVQHADGQRYPWAWSLTIDDRFYQLPSKGELFRFLQSTNYRQHRITYGIARLPYDRPLPPQQLWQSLSVTYQLNALGQRLQAKSHNTAKMHPTPQHLESIINQVSREVGVEAALLHAIITQESAYRIDAVSHAGAKGLMQLMPSTAQALGVAKDKIFDPYHNIHAGARYIKQQLATFDGRLDWALAAYNAGPGAVKRYRGIPPYKETRQYVPKVLKAYRTYKRQQSRQLANQQRQG